MNKFKNMSPILLDMIIADILYLILGEIVILIFLPNKTIYAIGFMVGVIISIVDAIHMKKTLQKSLHLLGKSAVKKTIYAYTLRLFVIVIIFCGMYFTGIGNLFAGLIGMFALKLSAYLQPLVHKIAEKNS